MDIVDACNRIQWLAAHALPMPVIAERLDVPEELVEAVLSGAGEPEEVMQEVYASTYGGRGNERE